MSIAPLNITAAGDSGTAYAAPKTAEKPDPVVSTVAPAATPEARRATDSELNDAVGKLNDFAAANAAAPADANAAAPADNMTAPDNAAAGNSTGQ